MLSYLFSNPLLFLIYLASLLIAIAIHEFSHAWAADQLGDPTPRLHGRLKLNPFVHIDPIGLLFILFFGFGWGKPVGFDPFNLKNPRRDAALISLAGPFSNFVLALILSLALHLTGAYFLLVPMISLNVVLGVFNLLPIHPLDGFKIVGGILPEDKAHEWYQLERYGMIFLLMLIFPFGSSSMLDLIIRPITSFVLGLLIPSNFNSGVI